MSQNKAIDLSWTLYELTEAGYQVKMGETK